MVKADAKRNYYADLEIGQNADTEEIKKQFRKLGTQTSACCILLPLTSDSPPLPPGPQPRKRARICAQVPVNPSRSRNPQRPRPASKVRCRQEEAGLRRWRTRRAEKHKHRVRPDKSCAESLCYVLELASAATTGRSSCTRPSARSPTTFICSHVCLPIETGGELRESATTAAASSPSSCASRRRRQRASKCLHRVAAHAGREDAPGTTAEAAEACS
jgi:hypothetical protein